MSRFPDLSNEYVLVIDDRVKDPKTNFLTSLRQQIKRKAGALPYIGGSARYHCFMSNCRHALM